LTGIVASAVGWVLTVAPVPVGVGELLQLAAVSARAATAIDITPTWRPLRRIVSDFRYVIISGLPLCRGLVFRVAGPCRSAHRVLARFVVPRRRPDAPGV
jgi:hypothetical protein